MLSCRLFSPLSDEEREGGSSEGFLDSPAPASPEVGCTLAGQSVVGIRRSRKGSQSSPHTQDNIKRRQFDKSTSLVIHLVKNLPAMQETQVQPLSGEDPLEKEMATHSSILAWKVPWTEEPGKLPSMGSQRIRHDLETKPPQPVSRWPCHLEGMRGLWGEEQVC